MTDREKRQTDREREKQRKPETDTQKKKNQREAEKKSGGSTDTNRERPGAQEAETEKWGQRDGERNAD